MQVPGTLGKHQIRRQLGVGAMGTVYEGWDPVIERLLAIKTVQLPHAPDEEMAQAIARFRREAQAAGRLTHPNIVGVFDYGETDELAYIVMEFVDGPALKDLLDKHERFSLPTIARIMEDLLAGLQFSHDRGVVHRDIKPANVMLTKEGQAKIADFGIARIESSSMTQAGTMLGTPAYMSPEQFMGLVVDARSDIYSSGVLLYQLLTGERPFDGSMTAIMHKALNTDPPMPSRIAVTVPKAFDAVVSRAMAKRPEDRFSSASEFMAAIRGAIAASARSDHDAQATVIAPSRSAMPAAPVASPPRGIVRTGSDAKPSITSPAIIGAGIAGLAVLGGIGYFLLSGTSGKHVAAPEQIRPPAVAATSAPSAPLVAAIPPASKPILPPESEPVSPPVSQPTLPPASQSALPPVSQPVSPPASLAPPVAPTAAPIPRPATLTPTQVVPVPEPAAPSPLMQAAPAPEPPAPSPLERARMEARSVPCSVLNVADGPRISGMASAGQDLDQLLAGLQDIGPLTDDVTRVDRFACGPMVTVAAFVRQSWDSVPPAIVLRPAQREVANGTRLGIDVSTTLPTLYVDVFQNDGSVRHLTRPSRSGAASVPPSSRSDGASVPHVEFAAGPATGPALLVAIGSAVALNLGVRPEVEKAAAYLAVLSPRLRDAGTPPSADVAMVTVLPASPIIGKPPSVEPSVSTTRPAEQLIVKSAPQPHSQSLRSSRCANIISRAQLGETLSDDELAALRTECRS